MGFLFTTRAIFISSPSQHVSKYTIASCCMVYPARRPNAKRPVCLQQSPPGYISVHTRASAALLRAGKVLRLESLSRFPPFPVLTKQYEGRRQERLCRSTRVWLAHQRRRRFGIGKAHRRCGREELGDDAGGGGGAPAATVMRERTGFYFGSTDVHIPTFVGTRPSSTSFCPGTLFI